jgi:uncharacterized delta-60 repeat protein
VSVFAAGAVIAAGALASAGDLDASFSADGKRFVKFGNGDDVGMAVAAQADGRIVAAGYSDKGGPGDALAVTRLMPGGRFDSSFAGDGRRTVQFGGGSSPDSPSALGLAVDPDGRIVVAANALVGTDPAFAVMRLKPDGSLDHAFSGDGKRTLSFLAGGTASDVAIQPDGRIVVAGSTASLGSDSDFAVARMNVDGTLDQTFSGDGKRTIRFDSGDDVADAVALQSDGMIVVAGTAFPSGAVSAVARLTPQGGLDHSFSDDGKRTVTYSYQSSAYDVGIQADDRIVLGGAAATGVGNHSEFAVARLTAAGRTDTSFSQDGQRLVPFSGPGGDDDAFGLAIQDNGRIVLAGQSQQGATTGLDFAVARLKLGGAVDPTFSGDGRTTVPVSSGGGDDSGRGVALDVHGRIVVVGQTFVGTTKSFGLIRLLAR